MMFVFEISKADRMYLLAGLRAVDVECGYTRELVARLEATKCPDCGGSGYAPYVGGDDEALCAACDGSGFR